MDPAAALDEADISMAEERFDYVATGLAAYFMWRSHGGFQPPNGDSRAIMLLEQLGAIAMLKD
jgi:hypothetical protein